MGFFSFLDPVLNAVFGPLLGLSSFMAILILSLVISLIIILCYKYFTDQDLMKQLKEEMKAFQKQMKELKEHPEQMMKVQKKAMETNMKYMMHSMKPTLITFIPIILIFGWMNAHLAYFPLAPDTPFTVSVFVDEAEGEVGIDPVDGITIVGDRVQPVANKQATFTLNGNEGEYYLRFSYKDNEVSTTEPVIITNNDNYATIDQLVNQNGVKKIRINNEPIKPLGSISIFGWKPGWLGTYIILSIAFSMLLRKLLRVY